MKSSPSILFMGTPQFAATALQGLITAGFNVTGVITRPDTSKGRSSSKTFSEGKIVANEHKIPVFQPENKSELVEVVKKLNPNLIVVAAYGMIVPKEVLDTPKYGALNIHGSLLPKYRGASPIAEAILNGDKETGITIMKMSLGMDEGDIISAYKVPIIQHHSELSEGSRDSSVPQNDKVVCDTTATLAEKMAELGAKAIIETIPDWISGKLKAIPQDNSLATYCRKITKEDGHIDWTKPAEQIERMVRAYQPWPTAYTFVDGIRVKILEARLCEKDCEVANPGVGVLHLGTGHICVRTGKDVLKITLLQPEGKKPMSATDYINGNKQLAETKLT